MQRAEDVSGAVRHMKKSGALWIVICAFAVGIILLIIGGSIKDSDDDVEIPDAHVYSSENFDAYKSNLANNIKATCRKIIGGGDVVVLLDFSSSGQIVYAQNSNVSSDGDRREEYVIVGNGSNAQALYIGQSFPSLSGIGVVCPSSTPHELREKISGLLSATYGIPLTRIYVI
ncbi:MAG: hypothetical protein E7667_05075 [Ruminococcaceae bacterium]|nr:hypothetical protein [Oscillospiraceae bacterium]